MQQPSRFQLQTACRALSNGGVVAYPTEAVWGLGCDPLHSTALQQLLTLKRRRADKGLILIAATIEQLSPFWHPDFTPTPEMLASWPGPHTWLVPKHPQLPPLLSGEHQTIAVRVSAHLGVIALCQAFGGAITSTSANRSGGSAAITERQCRHRFGNRIHYLSGPTGGAARPSTIRHALSGAWIRR
ncbi:tRNA threonylcarbamoyladenosine biosynthesis protein RimN [Ectothiorhodospiraceae bacterium BW-2]|nr:tRNA threonylcarbamoyladenosine biosynthesis protein RimN [Ectothiorhodospiraceae bacterium BW-2]